jgi:hypothetical protein
LLHSLAIFELLNLLRQQLPVEDVRMVEVNLLTLLWCQIGGVVVIRVSRDDCCTRGRQLLGNALHDGSLART